ncbi:AAA family ATPase [Pseudoxanthomonas sp.]|uniref:ParA family protein n=1 Tax=Pseudoxanthomonas sp. TaxID=1871049 RepID=UPI0028C3CD4C|nr:AAA family ATPase [Pseudoxanthomonas sp.]
MSIPVLTFFNNKGGVGKTSLVFHVAWMLSEMGVRVVAVDLDPQANLTSAFLSEDDLEVIWESTSPSSNRTVYQCVKPLMEVGDILGPQTQRINPRLHLVPGDLGLASFEDFLSQEWPNSLGSGSLFRSFRVLTAFWQIGQMAAEQTGADLILADVGPNLGAINRSALIGTDYVATPLAADIFSLQGLRNLGPMLRSWRADWAKRKANWNSPTFSLPDGGMTPIGYVMMQHSERLARPVKAYKKWGDRIPETYKRSILQNDELVLGGQEFDALVGSLRHYRSLVPMAQEVRKPIFKLSTSDGAIGSHSYAVRDASSDFRSLTKAIVARLSSARGRQLLVSPAPLI